MAGCVSFRIADARSKFYIPIAWVGGEAITKITKKVDDFCKRWLLVDARVENPLLVMPTAPPKKWARWASQALVNPQLIGVYKCLQGLREAGVTGQMVARDFTRRRIAPLQWHSVAMWLYTGLEDKMRLCKDNLTPETLNTVMETLFTSAAIPSPTTDDARPLFTFAEETVRAPYSAALPSTG